MRDVLRRPTCELALIRKLPPKIAFLFIGKLKEAGTAGNDGESAAEIRA